MAAILGKKLGMSQIFTEEGDRVPVTVIEAGPCTVTQVKTPDKDGYSAIQFGFGDVKDRRVNKPLGGHFKKAGVKPLRYLAEIRVADDVAIDWVQPPEEAGKQKPKSKKKAKAEAEAEKVTEAAAEEAPGSVEETVAGEEVATEAVETEAVESEETAPKEQPQPQAVEPGAVRTGSRITVEAFQSGQKIKVSGVSKGKGFAGVIKRHGFAGGPASHGAHFHRAPGSVGASAYPSRVFKGHKLPGQMGNKNSTQRGLTVFKSDPEQNLLFIKGAVPGSKNDIVFIQTD